MFSCRVRMLGLLLCSLLSWMASPGAVLAAESKLITSSTTGMTLTLIPAGTFMMGSPESESQRRPTEGPQHPVEISHAFYMGVYEVTQGQYENVMGKNPSRFKGSQLPVESVNWHDTVSFCKHLSELPEEKAAGRAYRLPTEAEWEYACRATSTTSYCFGGTAESHGEFAWFGENSERKTHPVSEKKANRWGLYDMHGNVFEWCQDWGADYLTGAATDPQGPSGGSRRVGRGGSWNDVAASCRAAYRYSNDPTFRSINFGFRLALSPSARSPEADIEKR